MSTLMLSCCGVADAVHNDGREAFRPIDMWGQIVVPPSANSLRGHSGTVDHRGGVHYQKEFPGTVPLVLRQYQQ